jgi:hypothetical protein
VAGWGRRDFGYFMKGNLLTTNGILLTIVCGTIVGIKVFLET